MALFRARLKKFSGGAWQLQSKTVEEAFPVCDDDGDMSRNT
jgi:hypothetical protein